MEIKISLSKQLGNSIEVLKKAIENADGNTWNYGNPPFFQIVFHIINALDMYFTTFDDKYNEPESEYVLPENLQIYSDIGFFDNEKSIFENEMYIVKKSEMIEFLNTTREKLKHYFTRDIETQFEEDSGFSWLNMNKFELIIHNIRHIMGHTGVLNEYLKSNNCEITGWIGRAEL